MNTATFNDSYPNAMQWHQYAAANQVRSKMRQNQDRLQAANALTRELQAHGIRVQYIDIAVPTPILYLDKTPLTAMPLKGVLRRRVDSEVFELRAKLNGCEVVWSEFEDEVAA